MLPFANLDALMKYAVYGRMEKGLSIQSLNIGTKEEMGAELFYADLGISQMPPTQLTEEFGYGNLTEASFVIASYINGVMGDNPSVITVNKDKGRFVPSREFLAVSFIDPQTAREILSGILWIKNNGFNPIIISQRKEGKNMVYRNVITCEEYTDVVPSAANGFKGYAFFKATPAEVRTNSCVLINVGDNGLEFIDTVLEKLTLGASKIFQEDGDMSVAELIRSFTRLALWGTYSRSFGLVNSYAIVKLFDKNKATDGFFFARAAFVAKGIKKHTGITVNPQDLVGYCFRARPTTCKGMVVCIDDWMMRVLNNYLADHVGYQKHGDVNALPDFIADRNAWKADIDYNLPVDFRVLAPMTKMKHPDLNIQVVSKIANTPEFPDIIKEHTKNLLNNAFQFADQTADDVRQVGIEEFANPVVSQLLMTLAPEFGRKLMPVYSNAIKTAAESAMRLGSRFNLPLNDGEAVTQYLVPDVSCIFGASVMPQDRVYSKSIPNQRVIGIRVPSVHPREFEDVTGMELHEVLDRINDQEIEAIHKEWLRRFFIAINRNCVVVPDSNRFKALGGGLDFDTDTMMFFWNRLIVSAFNRVGQQALDAQKPANDDGSVWRLDHNGRVEAYVRSIESGSNQIGIFVYALTRLLEVISASDDNAKKKLVGILFGSGNGNYERRFMDERYGDDNIAVKETEGALADMKECNINNKDIVDAILHDLVVILKTHADRVIDAAKTADIVKMELPISKVVGSDLFSKFALEIDFKGKKAKLVRNQDDRVNYKGEKKAVIVDGVMARGKRFILRSIAEKVEELLNRFVGMEQDDINFLQPVARVHSSILESLKMIKYAYGDHCGLKAADLKEFHGDTKNPVARAKVAWSKQAIACEYDMFRTICDSDKVATAARRGALALYTAMKKDKGIDVDASNNMATVVAGYDVMALAYQTGYIAEEYAKTQLFAMDDSDLQDGDTVELIAGAAIKDGRLIGNCRAALNGAYQVKLVKENWYVVAKIVDLIEKCAPINQGRAVFSAKIGSMTVADMKNLILKAKNKELVFSNGFVTKKGDRLLGDDIEIKVMVEGKAAAYFHGTKFKIEDAKFGVVDRDGKEVKTMLLFVQDTNVKDIAAASIVEDEMEFSECDWNSELPF